MKKLSIILLISMLGVSYASAKIHNVRSSRVLDGILEKNTRVIIKFDMPACPTCKKLLDTLKNISNRNPHITFVKINTIKYPELGKEYKKTNMDLVAFMDHVSLKGGKPGKDQKVRKTFEKPQEKTEIKLEKEIQQFLPRKLIGSPHPPKKRPSHMETR